jgi:hypothetical protein
MNSNMKNLITKAILLLAIICFTSTTGLAQIAISSFSILPGYLQSGKIKYASNDGLTPFKYGLVMSRGTLSTGQLEQAQVQVQVVIKNGTQETALTSLFTLTSSDFKYPIAPGPFYDNASDSTANLQPNKKPGRVFVKYRYMRYNMPTPSYSEFFYSGNSYETVNTSALPEPTIPTFAIGGPNYFCTASENFTLQNLRPTDNVTWSVLFGDLVVNGTNTSQTVNVSKGFSGGHLMATILTAEGTTKTVLKEVHGDEGIVYVNTSSAVFVHRIDGRITCTVGFGKIRNVPGVTAPFKIYINGVFLRNVANNTTLATFYVDNPNPVEVKIETVNPCGQTISDTGIVYPTTNGDYPE